MDNRRADVVIVNWNGRRYIEDCVSSVERFSDGRVASITVVDNGSTDGSVGAVENKFAAAVRVVANRRNIGFGAACNQGAAISDAPYILFLNPDAQLYKGTLTSALAAFESSGEDRIGVVGVQLINEAGEVARSCSRSPKLGRFIVQAIGANRIDGLRGSGVAMKEWTHDSTRLVDQVMGAFFLVPRGLFEELGGFDDRFFVYFEEVDFSLRARSAGYRSMYLAEAQAFHAGGGTSRQVKACRLFYSLRSRLLYGFKHFPAWQAWSLVSLTCVVEPVTRMGFCLLRRDWSGIGNTIKGYRMLWMALPHIIRGDGRIGG